MKSLTMLLAFVSGLFMRAIGGKREAGQRFWSFRAAADEGAAELLLYGPISDTTWWGDEVTPKLFAEDLAAQGDVKKLSVRIFSYGGDPFAALAIRDLLNDHPAELTVRIDGAAASAATLIAPKRAKVVMPSNSAMLIHHPRAVGFISMSSEDMRAYAEHLDAMSEQFVNGYADRSGMAPEEINALMSEDRWMYAPEAVEKGFADELLTERMVASVDGEQLKIGGVGLELAKFDGLDVAEIATEEPAEEPPAEEPVVETIECIGTPTVDFLAVTFPSLVTEIRAAAREEGVTAERERQAKLDRINTAATAEIVAKAKQDGTPVADVHEAIIEAGLKSERGIEFLNRRAADAHASGANGVAAGVAPDGDSDAADIEATKAQAKSIADRMWPDR